MSTIIHTKIKGTTYCYRSESYWDKESKSSKSKRVLIGKIDPATGEMVPTQPRGRRKREEGIPASSGEKSFKKKEAIIAAASENDVYRRQCEELKRRLLTVEKELAEVKEERNDALARLKRLTEAIRMLPV